MSITHSKIHVFFYWQIILAPGYVIWNEINELTVYIILELIRYILSGLLYLMILIVFVFKKDAIFSNYQYIQTHFIEWSNKKRINLYQKNQQMLKYAKRVQFAAFFVYFSMVCGPIIEAFNDLGKIPLGDRSHFPLLWPRVRTTRKVPSR